MSYAPFSTLQRRPVRRVVAVLAACTLLLAGFAQAAHYHKPDRARNVDTHLQCLLCLHVDRWMGPPALPQASGPTFSGGALIASPIEGRSGHDVRDGYNARGPPLV
jgi:hypothetical protein